MVAARPYIYHILRKVHTCQVLILPRVYRNLGANTAEFGDCHWAHSSNQHQGGYWAKKAIEKQKLLITITSIQ